MAAPTEQERLKAIMEYYVEQYLHSRRESIKDEVKKHNYFTDPDFVDVQMDQELDRIKGEISSKFNDVCMFFMEVAFSGREAELRKFEVLFLDLMERTLLKETGFTEGIERLAKEIANVLERRGKDIV